MWHLHDTAVFEDVIMSFIQLSAQFLQIGSGCGGKLKKKVDVLVHNCNLQPFLEATQVFKGHMNSVFLVCRGSAASARSTLQGGVQET